MGTSTDLEAVRSSTAEGEGYRPGYEVTAERILEYIAERNLRPGDRLPTEAQLAQALGVSHSVAREAVKILSALGRVRAQRGRGLFVADEPGVLGAAKADRPFFMPADMSHVAILFEFRRLLDVEAARLAAQRATPVELRAIAAAVAGTDEGVRLGDVDLFCRADGDFHRAVAIAAHNPFLAEALGSARTLQHQSAVIGMHGTVSSRVGIAAKEHRAIFDAIHDGLPDQAAAAAATHVDNSHEDYRQEIQRRFLS